jgi:hypothetical protein
MARALCFRSDRQLGACSVNVGFPDSILRVQLATLAGFQLRRSMAVFCKLAGRSLVCHESVLCSTDDPPDNVVERCYYCGLHHGLPRRVLHADWIVHLLSFSLRRWPQRYYVNSWARLRLSPDS